jgi:hypothetical protein
MPENRLFRPPFFRPGRVYAISFFVLLLATPYFRKKVSIGENFRPKIGRHNSSSDGFLLSRSEAKADFMVRTTYAVGLLVLVVATTGCRMGAHPYDYCGPVWSEGKAKNCDPNYRAGSVLNPGTPARHPQLVYDAEPAPAMQPAATANTAPVPQAAPVAKASPMARDTVVRQMKPVADRTTSEQPSPVAGRGSDQPSGATVPAPAGTAAGATRILSVTDRKVGESARTETEQKVSEQPKGQWVAPAPRPPRPIPTEQ